MTMKRDYLRNLDIGNGAHLSDELIDQIMAEHGKSVNGSQQQIQTLTAERDGLKQQLTDAHAQIQSYKDMDIDGIKRAAADWETKYNAETKRLQAELDDTRYSHSVQDAVSGIKFSSGAARKQFVADLTAKKLPLQDGKLMGLDDYVAQYKQTDPEAFAAEGGDGVPYAVRGGGGSGGSGSDAALRAAFGLSAK